MPPANCDVPLASCIAQSAGGLMPLADFVLPLPNCIAQSANFVLPLAGGMRQSGRGRGKSPWGQGALGVHYPLP